MRRTAFIAALALAAPIGFGLSALPSLAAPRVVPLTLQKYAYSPDRIELKKGETVTLELRSLDRVHGFNLAAFKIRMDVGPDAPVQVEITPDQAGTFEFHCDIFCGSGHEEMDGVLVVTE